MAWPIYYKELIKTSNSDSPIGIVSLWTVCSNIYEKIDPQLYNSAGQLYTKNGINYLVRNLLANKKIRYIILCGQDRSGSGAELKKLWQEKKIDCLHEQIPKKAIDNLTSNVKIIDLTGEQNPEKIEKEIRTLDLNIEKYGKSETFPEPAEKDLNELECSWPTDTSIFKVRGKTIAQTWLKALKMILKFGDIKNYKAVKTKEIYNLCSVIEDEDPDNFYIPDWLNINKEKIEKYIPQIITGEKIKGVRYTYGHRMQKYFKINQIDKIIERLKNNKNAREALAILFDPQKDHESNNCPCIVMVHALFNKGKLNFNVYARSHDIFGGWPLNLFALRKLQKIICKKTNIPMGVLSVISVSAHIYDFNWEQALNTVKENLKAKFDNDPRGYFKIEIDKDKKEIIVKHFSPSGNFLKKYSENIKSENPTNNLIKKIDEDLAMSLVIHGAYLGKEIQKAEIALKTNINYIQDKPLNIK